MNQAKLRTLRTVLLPYLAWDGPEFPQNTPSPTLKCCGGVKNHLRLATTGTLRSQLLPKTSRAHLPTSLLESPSFVPNPSLLLAPGTNCSGDLSRPSFALVPSTLPPSHQPPPPPRSQIGTTCKHGDRREGDRSVSSPSSPDGLPLPSPSPSSGCSCHRPLRAMALAAFELPLPLCLKIRDGAPAFPDRLPCSIMAVPMLNGSSLVHGLPVRNADGA